MQHPFKHPLATHAAGTILGRRRNGSPIYAIAGGNGEGEGAAGTSTPPPAPAGDGTPPTPPVPAPPAPTPPTGGEGTDWKAEARKWERLAKENKNAATELDKLRDATRTEQEKAVAAAEKAGRTAAASEYGAKLASAEFRAAVAAAGVDLGEAADLIDTRQFVGEDGDVDTKAIQAAVKKLAKLAPKGAGRSGADMGGAGGSGDQAASLDKQIEEATKRRDFATVIRLKRQRAATT